MTVILSGRLLLISILKWYGIDEASETTEALLELILLEEVDLPLVILSTSMSVVDGKWAIFESLELMIEVKSCLFANSLMSTTMQDSGTRERSNVVFKD